MYSVWSYSSGNRIKDCDTLLEAEDLIKELVELGWDEEELFIDIWE